MNKWFLLLVAASTLSAAPRCDLKKEAPQPKTCQPLDTNKPEGWSLDLGGAYTWMSFLTPPTYSGSTGGILGRISYQRPSAIFGQVRSIYNIGPLSSPVNETSFQESYTEFVGGYCFTALNNWTITPYAGIGFDFLSDNRTGYSTIAPIHVKYHIYYALVGLETHYLWRQKWMFGLQVDCLPTFDPYLKIETLSGTACWTLENRVGAAVHLPIAYRYAKNFWLELAPYYRFLPIGDSDILGLPNRNLNQWGAFLTFRFFL